MSDSITIRIPDDLKDDLKGLSQIEHKTVSDIVKESIRDYVSVHKFRAIRKKILPFAESQGLLEDEDIFEQMK